MKKITLALFMLFTASINAQNYSFENTTAIYSDLINPISINNGEVWDDPQYPLTLPFSMTINGSTSSEFAVFDGYIAQLTISNDFEIITPSSNDLVDRGDGGTTSLSPISYVIDGIIGSRIVKIEYKNVGAFNDFDLTMFMNFQIWLYEGTNVIEYHFGPSLITDSALFYGGETGGIIGLTSFSQTGNITNPHFLEGAVSNPTLVTTDVVYVTGTPAENSLYRFTPILLNNQQFTSINATAYPNPFNDYIAVNGLSSNYDYTIYDINGKVIKSGTNNSVSAKIDTQTISTGIYLLKITSENETATKKIIKM